MRATLLSWLPADLRGARLLDAGCGTGALAIEAARRGADVLAIDISPTLVDARARARAARISARAASNSRSATCSIPTLGRFDHVVAMDSLIHYEGTDIAHTLAALAPRTSGSIVFTIAPRTPALTHHACDGPLLPARRPLAGDSADLAGRARAPLRAGMRALAGWRIARSQRIDSGFYISQALEARAAMNRASAAIVTGLMRFGPAILPFADAGDGGIADVAPAAAVAVPGHGWHGGGAADRHAQSRDDRRTRRFRPGSWRACSRCRCCSRLCAR